MKPTRVSQWHISVYSSDYIYTSLPNKIKHLLNQVKQADFDAIANLKLKKTMIKLQVAVIVISKLTGNI